MPISFDYQYRKHLLSKKSKIINWILLVCYLEKKEVESIDYVFCDDAFLFKLNQQFLKHSTLTDIITFDNSTKRNIAAEIYISTERVEENAQKFKTSFNEELRRVIIHGVLHCIGYSDKSPRHQLIMRKKEEEYLQLFTEMI